MPLKKIRLGDTHGYIGDKPKYKKKPKEIDNDWIKPYWLERDRVIYKTTKDEQTIEAIKKRYNIL